MAGFDEAGEAADGEAITNKIPRIEEELKEDCRTLEAGLNAIANHEMCLIHKDFKHFLRSKRRISAFAARSRQSCRPRSCQSCARMPAQ